MEPSDEKTRLFIEQNLHADIATLALKLAGRTDIDTTLALRQIEGRQRLAAKVPSWAALQELRFPQRLSLEQCSGEHAARYKARLAADLSIPHGAMADLTGGFGVDFAHLAPLFGRAFYVERSAELCDIVRHNLPILGVRNAEVIEGDATDVLHTLPALDLIFVDPARRDGAGRKTVALADCTPDVGHLAPALLRKAPAVLVKLSPMIDLHEAAAGLHGVAEIHVVADHGECKEVLILLRQGASGEPRIVCADGRFVFTASEEAAATTSYATAVGRYLYEPGSSVLKAGAFRLTAQRYGVQKLHPNSHLYTADHLVPDFPGRSFAVTASGGTGRRDLRNLLSGLTKANITVRNFPATVAELRKRWKLRDGGDTYLFATTLASGGHSLIACHKAT